MDKNRVQITIGNQSFTVLSQEPEETVLRLAAAIDEKLSGIMKNNTLSLTQGLVLTSLEMAQLAKQQGELAKEYKNKISGYLEDAEKAMTERDKYKRELDKLKEKMRQA